MSEYSEPPSHDGNRRTGWAELGTGETVELARIGARFGARVLDTIILAAVLIAFLLFYGSMSSASDASVFSAFGVASLIVSIIFGVGYEVVQIALWGQTLGKRMVGISVIHATHGGLPGWGKAFGRYAIPALLAGIPVVGWILSVLCYVSATWDRVYQGWHDKAAGTLVVSA